MDLSARFRYIYCRFAFGMSFGYIVRSVSPTVLAGSPPCSAHRWLCMFVLPVLAALCDAFQFFCAVILCGDLHGFSNLCRELYAAAYVLRAAILYNIFVYSCCRQGGFTRRRERRSDSAVFCRGGSLLIAEFYPLRCFDTGDILPCFPALNLRFCLQ